MPKRPEGQKRPADTISGVIVVAKIATSEIEENLKDASGKTGEKARAEKMTADEPSAIAKKAPAKRWA